ncbi:lipopolysaccharide biosynthesis protein [Prosthecomicrobium sp. N25]|uniref:lipopolysaccharide biosynthesis protein n=1 Tax=Prosthecomicrobium sp. N25 TaxID=3129254 RepID=UPI00307781BA
MIDSIRKLLRSHAGFVRSVIFYGFGQVALKGLDLLAFILLARALTPHELGFVGTMALVAFLVVDICTLGIPRIGVPRFIATSEEDSRAIAATGASFSFVFFAVLAAAILLVPTRVLETVVDADLVFPLRLYILSFAFRPIIYMEFEIFRMTGRTGLHAFLETIPSMINVVVLFLFLDRKSSDLVVTGYSQIAGWAPMFLWATYRVFALHGFGFSKMGVLLRYSLPLIIHRAMTELSSMASRWVVLFMLGLGAAGGYTFLSRLGDLTKLAAMPLQKAWLPSLLRAATKNDQKSVGQMAIFYMLSSFAIYLVMIVFYDRIAAFIDKSGQYAMLYDAIAPVVVGAWLTSYNNIFGIGFFVSRQNKKIIPISVTALALNVVLSVLFVWYGGLQLAVYANVIVNAFFAFMTHLIGKRYFSITYRPAVITAYLTLAGGLALALVRILT